MKAVIFAAGEGKRMRPLTLERPKPLLEVLGKPLLYYTFSSLPDSVDEVILIVGYKEEMIRQALGQEYLGKHITYITQEKPEGTAPALLLARPYLGEEKFLTLFADDIYAKEDIEKLLTCERGMLLAHAEDPTRFGVVELGANNQVIGIEEKPEHPKSDLISTGVYLLDAHVFAYEAPLHENGERYLPDMANALAKDFAIIGVESKRWIQIGYPEDLANAEKIFLNEM